MAMLSDNVAEKIDAMIYEVYRTPLDLSPEVAYKKVDTLYERAKKDQWNVSEQFNFKKKAKEEKPKPAPQGEYAMTREEREAIARIYSQLYYGERGAQIISSQMVGLVPHNEASKFLSTQSMDEARHVEIFEKMLMDFDRIYPMNPFLALLLSDMCSAPSWQEKIVGMNMLVEGLALTVFRTMVDTFENHPKLKRDPDSKKVVEPLRYILKDEARHVGFAMVYLPETLKKGSMSPAHQMRLQVRQLWWMLLLYGSVKYHEPETTLVGVDYMKILKGILGDHQARVEEMKVDVLLRSDQIEKIIPVLDRIVEAAMLVPERLMPAFLRNTAQRVLKVA